MNENATVLLVEDEGNDVFLMQRSVRKLNSPVLLQVARDGVEAIEYLSGEHKFADRDLYPLPELILLDIKMPRKSGFEVLVWLKQDITLSHIPIIMLTSSKVEADMNRAHELGANAYLIKPLELEELKALFTRTEEFLAVHAA